MRKFKILVLGAVVMTLVTAFGLSAQAADVNNVDLTVKIDAPHFWSSFYSTAYGEENTITLYKIKNVVVEIKSGSTILDSFTFTPDSDQSHHFLLTTPLSNIIIQYDANTYGDHQFSFFFDYRPGQALSIGYANSQIMVKTPYLNYH